MAWNGSNSAGASVPAPKKPAKKSPGLAHGLIAGGAIVLIGIIALYFIGGESDEATVEKKGPTQIAEVEPEISDKVAGNEIEVLSNKVHELGPQKIGELRDGCILMPDGRLHRPKGIITNLNSSANSRYAIFPRRCDKEIASLLLAHPGATVIGSPRYKGRFKDEFLDSLKEPIIVTNDDSPDDAELKRAVIAAKIELKSALDAGEDIEQIMTDTREEFRKLGMYKNEIRRQLVDFQRKENVTDDDIADFASACNVLLEAKGIEPIMVGPLVRRNLKFNNGGSK